MVVPPAVSPPKKEPPAAQGNSNEMNPAELPWVPTTATTSPDNFGGLNPENEAALGVINTVPGPSHRFARFSNPRISSTTSRADTIQRLLQEPMANTNATATLEHGTSRLLALPSELIHSILSYLSPHDLAFVTATCHLLREHGLSDLHWRALVQDQVPGCQIRRSYPCSTFRDLYAAHDRVWFLPKFKIWFSDREMVGKMVLLRYDQRRGCIEGLQMVAVTEPTTFERWEETDSNVIIHIFRPTVKLHLENPILQFNVGDATSAGDRPSLGHRFGQDIPMVLPDRAQNMRSNFILTKPLDQVGASQRLLGDYPYGHIWPPPTIPAHDHVSGVAHGTSDDDDRPTHRSQVSDQTFRIRRWVQMGGWLNDFSVHMGDSTSTYSTLDPVLYTPTPTKPWRGIWVGDYVGHGCEFLLIHQPDDPPATDAELGLVRSQYETEEQWEQRRLEARIYRGRLEAIKLTGDANIPRGEYTFIADNLGPDGLVGIAEKQPFTGARMVHSTGHVAGTGFSEDKFIASQLILISPNKLAQYWPEFGFINFFERVNIDSFLDPETPLQNTS